MLTGELDAPVRISYISEQLAAVAFHNTASSHAFHNTAKEIYMTMVAVVVILQQPPTASHVVATGKLAYLTDSQAAYYG